MKIPEIQPFQFIRGTAFSERVQLANKVNEIIDGINQIGDIPDIQAQVDALSSTVSTIQAGLASTDADLDELTEQVNSLISEVNDTIKTQITALQGDVTALDSRMDTAESDISGLDSEVQGLLAEVVDGVAMSSTAHGTVQVQINHEDGSNDISQPIDLGLVEQGGIVLQSGTTDRSFKLIVRLTDGTSWQTNDFVIPEGGGTEVSVTNISIAQGTGTDKIQVKIGLSDGSTISSNDWTVVTPAEFSALGTRVTTAEGNITKNTGDISDLETRVQAIEDSPGFTLQPATATALGGVKIGTGIAVASDGTISIPIAGSALGLVKNGGNVVIDSSGRANVNLSGYATKSALNAKADKSTVTELGNDVSALDSRVSTLEDSGSTDFNPDEYDIYFGPSGTNITAKIVEKNTVQTTEPSLNLSSNNNTMSLLAMAKNSTGATTIIGRSETPIIKSVSGTVKDGKLIITVNGVSSGEISLP